MKNEYIANNFYMTRTPVFSIDLYKNLFDESLNDSEQVERIKKYLKNEKIREVLTNASNNLGEAIEKINNGEDSNKEDKVISSCLKYMIRMSTRTTPYGMLAGVSNGKFSDITNMEITDIDKFQKRCRPDMEWLLGVVDKIEKDESLVKDIRVRFNELHYINGERLNNPFISNCGQNNSNDESAKNIGASIRYTDQVVFIKSISKEFIKYDDIAKILIEKNPKVPQDKIYNFLFGLLKNEYLITELRPPLMNSEPTMYIIDKISKSENLITYYESLSHIKILIDRYNTLEIGEGISLYREILVKMKEVNESKIYLQTDLRVKNKKNTLSRNVANELEKTLRAMVKLTSENGEGNHLKEYKEEFIEEYGTYIEVPVMKLIDSDMGLGLPAGYDVTSRYRTVKSNDMPDKVERLKKLVFNKMIDSIRADSKEILLTDNDIDEICDGTEKSKKINLARSLEMNVFIAAESEEKIDEGDFRVYIGPNYGSYGAGKVFGRFMDILDCELEDNFTNIYENNKNSLGEEYMTVELAELTRMGRNGNITLNINPIEYEMAISTNYSGEKEIIDIRDLVVGIDAESNNDFYIRYIKNNKKVIFSTNNMLNSSLYSNISRFLIEVSNSKYTNVLNSIASISFTEYKYRPRIKYGKTILCPSIWNVSNSKLEKEYNSFEEFKDIFDSYKESFKIPKYVYLKKADNRLLLNLENNMHLMEIYMQLKKDSLLNIELTEIEFTFNELLTKDSNNNRYVSELVIPFTLESNEDKTDNHKEFITDIEGLETKSKYKYNKSKIDITNKGRLLFPGDDGWLYMKLYGNSERVNEVIGFDIYDFCKKLKDEGKIDKYFFIRYADPNPHIRLRIKTDSKKIWVLLPEINEWLTKLKETGGLSTVNFDTYNREVERYGGIEIVEDAENLFYKDSEYVASLLRLKKTGQISMKEEYIGIISIISILQDFGLAYETQKNLFLRLIDKNNLRDYFNKDRRNFMKITNSNNNWKSLREFKDGEVIYRLFSTKSESIKNFREKIDRLDEEGKLTNSKENILLSVIHMFCNRYMANSNWERTMLTLARHSLQSLEYHKKNNI